MRLDMTSRVVKRVLRDNLILKISTASLICCLALATPEERLMAEQSVGIDGRHIVADALVYVDLWNFPIDYFPAEPMLFNRFC